MRPLASTNKACTTRRDRAPSFREVTEHWWSLTAPRLAGATRRGYRWRLDGHVLPYFAELHLDEIHAETVRGYIAAKLAEQIKGSQSGTSHESACLLLAVLNEHDGGAVETLNKVARLAVSIAEYVGLSDYEVERIELAGRLHDVGKLAMPSKSAREQTPRLSVRLLGSRGRL
jgi:hypothetical protein